MPRPPSILIVDHDAARRRLLEDLLRTCGDVHGADSGEAALVRLGMDDYACIIVASPVAVDFANENATLVELFDRLAPNLGERLIVVTTASSIPAIQRAVELQAFAVFIEPFAVDDLRAAVRQCLRQETPERRFHGPLAVLQAARQRRSRRTNGRG